MRKLSIYLSFLGFVIFLVCLTGWINTAFAEVPDTLQMNEPLYTEHEKGIVQFNHKIHSEERVKSKDCGVCHHDEKGKPLANLKDGDAVQRCIECHTKIGKPPKGTKKEDELQWHQEAMHDKCRGCHKAYNKTKPETKAPTTCAKCHPKLEK